jgi:polyhydroxyalkanoate synthesis regulator phasin
VSEAVQISIVTGIVAILIAVIQAKKSNDKANNQVIIPKLEQIHDLTNSTLEAAKRQISELKIEVQELKAQIAKLV